MAENFFDRPILNSPYEYPSRHWELDEDGQPTNNIVDSRRRSKLITPEPDDLAEEIIENLEAGLNSFREVLVGLEKAS